MGRIRGDQIAALSAEVAELREVVHHINHVVTQLNHDVRSGTETAMPLLLVLMSRTGEAIAPCLLVSGRSQGKGAAGKPRRARFLARWSRAEAAPMPSFGQSSAGDPSEVTALEIRHWITSFRWFRKS